MLLPAALALAFTLALAAPVRALRRRGVGTYLGAALVLCALLGAVALLAWLVAAPALEWWSQLPATLQRLFEALERWRDAAMAPFGGAPAARRSRAGDPLAEQIASEGLVFTRLAVGEVLSFAFSTSATVLLLFFLLANEEALVAQALAAIDAAAPARCWCRRRSARRSATSASSSAP